MDYGKLFPHGNKEDEDLRLKGRGGCGSGNHTKKTKVSALFLELFTTMPYMTAFAGGLHLITISHLFIIINLLCIPGIIYIKGGEAKVDEGQLLLIGNNEDVDLQLDGRSGSRTKKKLRAVFLKLDAMQKENGGNDNLHPMKVITADTHGEWSMKEGVASGMVRSTSWCIALSFLRLFDHRLIMDYG